MPRPYSGKVHVSQSRIKRKSGIAYVYERTTHYDQKTRKTVASASKLIGKILPGSTDVVSTRLRKSNGLGAAQAVAIRRHVRLTDILEWAGRGSFWR